MGRNSVLDLAWKAAVLALLLFCAYRLETLQRSNTPHSGMVPTHHSAAAFKVSAEQKRREHQELQENLRATERLHPKSKN